MDENKAGFDNIAKQMDDFSKKVQIGIAREIKASAFTIASNAKRSAPKDTGRLVQLITVKNGANPFETEVISSANYSAYVEFGTGSGVSIPTGYEDIASLARGSGVRRRDYPAHPFLISSYNQEKPLLLERIKKIIENNG